MHLSSDEESKTIQKRIKENTRKTPYRCFFLLYKSILCIFSYISYMEVSKNEKISIQYIHFFHGKIYSD